MPRTDHDQAAALGNSRRTLRRAGADELDRRPWQHARQPPADTELTRFALWASGRAGQDEAAVLEAGLTLLAAARAEIDQLEAGLLFAARSSGLTWTQIADALGLASAQAAQQRCDRVTDRVAER